MVFRAKLRQLEFERRQARLVEAVEVRERWAAICAAAQRELEAWPATVAPGLVPLTDERGVRDALKREVYALLGRLRSAVIGAR
ncbi:MAG: hypothetical protein ACREUU_20750 [Gammaproteobacteria bacterium]